MWPNPTQLPLNHVPNATRTITQLQPQPPQPPNRQGIMEHPWTTDFGSAPLPMLQREPSNNLGSGPNAIPGVIQVCPRWCGRGYVAGGGGFIQDPHPAVVGWHAGCCERLVILISHLVAYPSVPSCAMMM